MTTVAESAGAGSVRAGEGRAGGADTPRQPGRGGSEPSLGQLVSTATRDMSTLVRKEIQLAKTELAMDAKAAGIGVGLLAGAGLFGFVAFLVLTVFVAEGLTALGLPRWLSYLIVGVVYLLVAGVLALVARGRLKKVKPPQRTIETVKDDLAMLRHPTAAPAAPARAGR